MAEVLWKKVDGYDYAVSSNGEVKRISAPPAAGTGHYARPERMLKVRYNNKGYAVVELWKDNQRKMFLVHRLVAEAFLENPDNLLFVNHKDENKENNCVDNLEWCSHEYNMNYGSCAKKIGQSNSIPVVQLSKSGEIINKYPSIIQADRETGISQGSIGDCLHGRRKTAGGYLWRYGK